MVRTKFLYATQPDYLEEKINKFISEIEDEGWDVTDIKYQMSYNARPNVYVMAHSAMIIYSKPENYFN